MNDGRTAETEELSVLLPGGSIAVRAFRWAGRTYLLGRGPDAQWPVELLREGGGHIRHGDTTAFRPVDLVTDAHERDEFLRAAIRTLGERRFQEWFPNPGRLLRLGDPGVREPADPYGHWVASEFDAAAAGYLAHIQNDPLDGRARAVSIRLLRSALDGRRLLLEIGPGVGIETLPLLEAGHEIIAVDVSQAMLERLRERARAAGVSERLRTCRRAASDVESAIGEVGVRSVDAAFSTFGALNCEPDLTAVGRAVAGLLKGGSPFVAGFFNRTALLELVGSLASGDRHRALARLRPTVPVGASRFAVDFHPWAVADLDRAFGRWFDRRRTQGFPVLLPPPDRARRWRALFESLPGALDWDARLGERPFWARLADHVWATEVRRGE